MAQLDMKKRIQAPVRTVRAKIVDAPFPGTYSPSWCFGCMRKLAGKTIELDKFEYALKFHVSAKSAQQYDTYEHDLDDSWFTIIEELGIDPDAEEEEDI